MTTGERLILQFFIIGVIAAIVSGELLFIWMQTFYGGNPGLQASYVNAPTMGTGIGAGLFSILLLVYPVIKKKDKSYEWDDYK
jgi:uncharacterized membrane protein YqiK